MRLAVLTCAVLAVAATGVPAAWAIPWDKGGAIPPSQTPAPSRPDPTCTQSYANDAPRGGPRVRFGIGPRLAGESGTGQTVPTVAEDPAKRDAALRRLQDHRFFAVRLNRLFMADGQAGIRRFQALARHFAGMGLDVELQGALPPGPRRRREHRQVGGVRAAGRARVRAHPPRDRAADHERGQHRAVAQHLRRGLPQRRGRAGEGVVAAKRESQRLGYGHQRIGFNYAWRFDFLDPRSDAAFWEAVGRRGGRRLRTHTDWVGVDIYPGTFVPGVFIPAPITDFGDAFLEGIAQTRECFMPKAGFTRRTPLRVEETGYATGPGRSESDQATAAGAFARAADRYRGTFGISDFRFFGLRDNNSHGPTFQQYFGLLRDDYSEKPAFAVYRRAVARYGAREPSR
jgi:hypothetical protein